MPLAAKCGGKLPTLHRVKRFLKKEHLVGRRYLFPEVLRHRADRTGYEYDINVLIQHSNLLRSFNAVHTGRHTNIQKYDGIRYFRFYRCFYRFDSSLALVSRVYVELRCTAFVGFFTKQDLFEVR